MEYLIEGRPDMPVMWLDTHGISQLAAAKGADEHDVKRVAIREQIIEKRRNGELFSFESDQMVEIEVTEQRVESCGRLLSAISQGVVTSYRTAQRAQRQIGMAAMFGGGTTSIPWTSAFDTDPFRDDNTSDFIVRVDLRPSDAMFEMQRNSNDQIARQWEEIRQDNLISSSDRATSMAAQLDAELSAMQRVAVDLSRRSSVEALLSDPNLNAAAGELISLPLADLRALGGAELGLDNLIDFYGSEFYRDLPFVRIEAELMARLVTGNEEITPSDVMDVRSIGAFLPYSTHLVIDRSKIEAVTALGLDERFGARVLRLLQLEEVL